MDEDDTTPALDPAADRKRRKSLDGRVRIDRAACVEAAKETGEEKWIGKWLKTSFGPGKLTADEFLYYRLYRDALSDEERSRFVGKRVQGWFHIRCNARGWFACAHDKLLYQAVLEANGLPGPELRAVHGRGTSRRAPWRYLQDDGELEGYLAAADTYPVFAKPIQGMYSVGAMLLHGLDGDEVLFGDGQRAPIGRLAAYIRELDEQGYLFQTPLSVHDALRPVVGDALPAARIMVLLDGEGRPQLHIASLKLPLGRHDADNYWRAGNMLAPIDLDSGRLGDAVTGVAHETRRLGEHPETGASLEGLVLPDWDEAKRLVLDAAPQFPGIHTQGWDVCFSTRGPVLLELNFGGDLNLHQLAHDRGLLDPEICRHVRRNGYLRKLPYA